MPKATKEELHWAYLITREEILKRLDKKVGIDTEDWIRIRDNLIDMIVSGEAGTYESKMSNYLERTVQKYLYPSDDYISLTDIARKFDTDNPSYLIQSWLRSRNTVEFLGGNGNEIIILNLMNLHSEN